MRIRTCLVLPLLALPTVACAAPAIATAPPAATPVTPAPTAQAAKAAPIAGAACAVWDRENSFARSVFEHDATTFAEHVLPGAVFVGDGSLLRGREAIVEAWGNIIRGKATVFVWHPTQVAVTGDPNVALSRGPYWIEFTKPDAPHRFLAGTFQSVWVRDTDSAWRVAIDGGTADPVPASEADVQKLMASIPAHCPLG
jgi:uncharacterized protein (TIGR02246 family)